MNKLFLVFIFLFSSNVFSFDKTFEEVKRNYVRSDLTILDRNKNVLDKIRVDEKHRTLEWIEIKEISHAFQQLLIQSEDRNFYEHNGVDWKALLKATVSRIVDRDSKRGASTISMQLVNALDPNLKGIKKGVSEKIDQIKESLDLEKKWTKDQILEAYLNIVPFRGELIGLNVASYTFFKKAAHALNNLESAILVSMIRSPNATTEMIAGRTCRLLNSVSCQDIYKKVRYVINNRQDVKNQKEYISIIDKSFVVKKDQNFLYTTLSKEIQETALTALHEQIKALKDQNLTDGAILVLNNLNQEVLAYVPNAGDDYSSSPRFDNIHARRQAGSTLKPFIYAKAFDENYLIPDSLVDDSPIDIPIGKGSIYFPRNYDNSFHGKVPAKLALGSSLNVPAVKMLMLVGGETIIELFKKLGLKRLEAADYYGPSLALGSVDVTLWDLTHAYRKLNQSDLFSSNTKDIMFKILSDPENRHLTFGTDSVLTMPFNVAVKTGTSKDMRDNWCIGYSKYFTVGVWVGNSSGKAMYNVSGITGAAPIFRKVMLRLHRDFTFQNQLIKLSKNTEIIPLENPQIAKITYPVEGEVIGVDKEIPSTLQKMPIEVSNLKSNYNLFLNGKKIENLMWPIERGHFELTLKDEADQLIQKVNFEVR